MIALPEPSTANHAPANPAGMLGTTAAGRWTRLEALDAQVMVSNHFGQMVGEPVGLPRATETLDVVLVAVGQSDTRSDQGCKRRALGLVQRPNKGSYLLEQALCCLRRNSHLNFFLPRARQYQTDKLGAVTHLISRTTSTLETHR